MIEGDLPQVRSAPDEASHSLRDRKQRTFTGSVSQFAGG